MSEPIERYKGNFWSLEELKKFIGVQLAKRLGSEQERLDNSNEKRMKKKQENEKQHKMLYPANGDARLRGVKGNNGCKLIKRLSN